MMYRALIILMFLSAQAFAQPASLSTRNKKAIEFYTEADNFRVRGQYSQAISLLTQAIDKDKNFVEAYYRLGIVYMSLNDYPMAIQYLEKGLSLTLDIKKQKVFWFDLGESYFKQGKYNEGDFARYLYEES